MSSGDHDGGGPSAPGSQPAGGEDEAMDISAAATAAVAAAAAAVAAAAAAAAAGAHSDRPPATRTVATAPVARRATQGPPRRAP